LALRPEIERVFAENFEVYGARKVWRQMLREGFGVARCTVERLMADLGLHGVIRGKPIRTTVQDKAALCPLDHVNRVFHAPAPNRLWLSDFTYVSTWSGPPGLVRLEFVHWTNSSGLARTVSQASTWPSSSMPMPAASSAGG
jgi:transposase InsO family protein